MTRPGRVLVVDDDPLQLELLQQSLAFHGFDVEVASRIEDVAALARRFQPDLVLLDVNMPDSPGGKAVALLRTAAPPGTRIILLSASDESTLRSLARDRGADGWLSKSVSATELGVRLKKVLGSA